MCGPPPPPPKPSSWINSNPTTINKGAWSELSFGSSNATSGNINGENAGISGNRRVQPEITTIYTYTVSGSGGNSTSRATVTVLDPPKIYSLTSSSAHVLAGDLINIDWVVDADSATLNDEPVNLSDGIKLKIYMDSVFVIAGYRDGQKVSQKIEITVAPYPNGNMFLIM